MKTFFIWLKSLFQKKCDHRFDYFEVVDANNPASSILCLHCSKSFTRLAGKRNAFTRLAGKRNAIFKHVPSTQKDHPGFYTIEFKKYGR